MGRKQIDGELLTSMLSLVRMSVTMMFELMIIKIPKVLI